MIYSLIAYRPSHEDRYGDDRWISCLETSHCVAADDVVQQAVHWLTRDTSPDEPRYELILGYVEDGESRLAERFGEAGQRFENGAIQTLHVTVIEGAQRVREARAKAKAEEVRAEAERQQAMQDERDRATYSKLKERYDPKGQP